MFKPIKEMTTVELLQEKCWMEQLGKDGKVRLERVNEEIQKRYAEQRNK